MAVNIKSVTLSDAAGYVAKFGSYIQKKSKLKVQVDATSTNGVIEPYNYKISVNGNVYYASTITTDVLKLSGTNTIVIQVSDSKGATATTTRTINVTAYNTPTINTASVIRCDANGTANKSGSYAKVTINATCTSLSGNTYTYRVRYKKRKDEAYTTISFSGTGATINESKIISGIDVNSSYDFLIEAEDYMSLSAKIKTLGTKFVLLNALANGLGVAIGKKAEYQNTFEVGYDKTILSKEVEIGVEHTDNTQKKIRFTSRTDAAYPQNTYIYGGYGDSKMGFGIYDDINELRILAYNNVEKVLISEATEMRIGENKVLTESDSGWQTLTLTSNFEAYSTNTAPKYRKIGNVVEVRGAVKPTTTLTSNNTEIVIGTLPTGYDPSNYAVIQVCQGSGQSQWTLTINTNGQLCMSRYSSGGTLSNPTTSTWLPFQAMFTVD